ncbi:Uncharacterized protein TCM_031650 [Theobroma cacao]|uniref:RNase H type-1 domain-containing protein n=1 Tax=Theobroma cacao TaxID=3641 RepID=A0A061FF78_THECC|nr:Uncharacterized protein TCM_031650 [Theobroma cacao]
MLVAAFVWGNSSAVIFETDSNNAVSWISNPEFSPWRQRNLVLKTRTVMRNLLRWKIQYKPRLGDINADKLAKLGVNGADDLLRVCPDGLNDLDEG